MQSRKAKFLRRMLSGVLAASIMLTSAVTAFAAKSSTNASTSIPGSSTTYDGSYIRIWLNSYSGLELTPNNGEKIYTYDVLYHRMYNIADTLLRSDPPLGSLMKYENGQWVAAKDNIDYPSDPDFIVNSSRTNMYYVKPGKYREERAYYLDKSYKCSITYDVLPGPRPSDVNPGKSDFKLSGPSSPIRVGETTVISSMLDINAFSYYKDVTWTLESGDDGPAHGEITVDPSYPALCLYSAKTPGTDWIVATDPLGKRKSISVKVLPPEHASAGLLRDVSVGSSVKLNVDGVPQEFIVVHQGKPSNLYDDSCNGTWLLMKYLLDGKRWPIMRSDNSPTANDNDYANSDIHKYLNNAFLDRLDNNIRAQIKEVKIPYRPGSGPATTVNSGSDGLSAKAFLLSGHEVHGKIDMTETYYGFFPKNEGSVLDFFAKSSRNGLTDNDRCAPFVKNGTKPMPMDLYWWLRTPNCSNGYKGQDLGGKQSIYIDDTGRCGYHYSCNYMGIRPALILPSSLSVSDDAFVIAPLSVDDLSVSPNALNMDIGDEEIITVKRLPEDATEDSISFSSENKGIATVGFNGTVTATGEGQTNIIITCGSVTKTVPVTVTPVIPRLEKLSFDADSLDMEVGDVEDCPARKVPAEAEGDITYSSQDPSIAIVDKNGKVTAVGEGETTITASCGDITAQIPVTVHPAPAPELMNLLLNPTGATIQIGESEQFTAVKVPDNAEGDVSFSILNPEIASVDENGSVVAIKPGETKLVASCGDISKEATITVPALSEPEKPKTTDLAIRPDDVTMQVGDKQPLNVTKEPADSEEPIIYESKDPSIAAVDPDGTITGISPGETTVVVTSGEITKQVPVKVQPAPAPALTDISLEPGEAAIPVGETKQFTAAKIPANADGDISFRVLNPEIASVDEQGLVTALGPGETKLVASCGGISKEAAITVPSASSEPEDPETPGTSDLTVQPESVTVGVGDKQPLGAEKEPSDSKDPITYESKDPGIATVDPDGTITGISPGETTVVVTSGSVTKEIPVKVEAKGPDDGKDDGKGDEDNSGNNNKPDDGSNTDPGNTRVGSLVLRNTGVNAGKNKAFNYRFTFPENAGGEYKMSGDVSGTVKDGSVITLYPGDEVRISGLPVGGSYRVEELDPGNRYSVRHKVDGIVSSRGFVAGFSIAKDERTTVEFINTKAGTSNGSSSSRLDRYDRDDSDRGFYRDDPGYDDGRHPTRRPNENPGDWETEQIRSEDNARVPLKGNPYTGR